MTAFMVSSGKLKIKLDAEETYKLFKDKASFSCYDPEIRHILKVILKKAKSLPPTLVDFLLCKYSVFILLHYVDVALFTSEPLYHIYNYLLYIFVCFYFLYNCHILRESWQFSSKESTCQCRRCLLVFLPGKFHGQRSLMGYRP